MSKTQDDARSELLVRLQAVTNSEDILQIIEDCGFRWYPDYGERTHCRKGHNFTASNTYVSPGTKRRRCLTCKRQQARQRYLRDKHTSIKNSDFLKLKDKVMFPGWQELG